jgi:CBS domain-containing protein
MPWRKWRKKNIGSLVVMDDETLLGIITDRHLVRNFAFIAKDSPATLVRDVMETRVLIARPEQSVEQCMALMTERRVRHLPVLEGKELIGIISIGDLVKSIIGDQKFIIDQLEHYIQGQR